MNLENTATRKRGFALVIVVMMLSFVVVLLVGLALYSRIETNVASGNQKLVQARRNALVALDIALGQLQKQAGPDRRVTAIASGWGGGSNPYWTGVWDATTTTKTPINWLVSGSETGTPNPSLSITRSPYVELVGLNSAAAANSVLAPKVDIIARGQPGVRGTARIGYYAWWVGDQGVKASVALRDPMFPTYSPYNNAEMRNRLRQQMAFGARPSAMDARLSGTTFSRSYLDEFEPRSALNTAVLPNVVWPQQMALLLRPDNREFGLADARNSNLNSNKYGLRRYFHLWTPAAFGVLANTKLGGLKTDLSLRPDVLGTGFNAWHEYANYMETATDASAKNPKPVPTYASDGTSGPLRRRYLITPPTVTTANQATGAVAPVLTSFAAVFTVVRAGNTPGNLEVRLRWQANLWNPYTSALVPEDLRIEVTGLPTSVAVRDNATSSTNPTVLGQFSIQEQFGDPNQAVAGSPILLHLPWPHANSGMAASLRRDKQADYQSWLPGRTYSWSLNASSNGLPASGNSGGFNTKLGTGTGTNWSRPLTNISVSSAGRSISLTGGASTITIRLKKKDGTLLATYTSPAYVAFTTSGVAANNTNPRFVYYFRLSEYLADGNSNWLKVADPRSATPPSSLYSLVNTNPTNSGVTSVSNLASQLANHQRLLFRDVNSSMTNTTGQSYNEDVPLFELPRGPILSVGMLQHLQIVGQRPYAIGNSWGNSATLAGIAANSVFDRYFFSGLATPARSGWSTTQPFPNVLLQRMPRRVAGDGFQKTDFVPSSGTQGWETACHTLLSGAFNVNSVDAAAWQAVLRGTRYLSSGTTQPGFSYLNSDYRSGTFYNPNGTTTGTSTVTVTPANVSSTAPAAQNATGRNTLIANDRRRSIPDDAVFYRFSQSAQETYKAEDPRNPTAANFSTWAGANNAPSATGTPNPTSQAATHLFRRGVVMLSALGSRQLAEQIVSRIRQKHAATGPFRSIEEFLAPNSLYGNVSLLEAAISASGINNGVGTNTAANDATTSRYLSSQVLTAADVMTALAPILFARSDTFIIRTYGEVVNPITQVTEGKAWAEAIVQRFPEPFTQKRNAANLLQNPTAAEFNSLATGSANPLGRRFKVMSFRWLTPQDI